MKERSARRAAPREGERSQVAEVLNICIVDPSTIWRHTAREILCRELDANGVRACVDEFYAPESMTSDGGCAYYDVVLADISDRQTREQYLRFFRDLRLTSPQTKLILLSADPLAALDVFIYAGDMSTAIPNALRILTPGGQFIFSCEAAPEDGAALVLQPSGRYAHQRSAIEALCAAAGFAPIEIEDTVLRHENTEPVNGFVVTAHKPA